MLKPRVTKFSYFKYVRQLARPIQLAVSLVLLNISVLFLADFLDLRADPGTSIHEARKSLAAALIEQLSSLASGGDTTAVENVVGKFASRNADVQAIALLLSDGTMLIRRGNLILLETEPGLADGTRVNLPIYRNDYAWGEVRIAFSSL